LSDEQQQGVKCELERYGRKESEERTDKEKEEKEEKEEKKKKRETERK